MHGLPCQALIDWDNSKISVFWKLLRLIPIHRFGDFRIERAHVYVLVYGNKYFSKRQQSSEHLVSRSASPLILSNAAPSSSLASEELWYYDKIRYGSQIAWCIAGAIACSKIKFKKCCGYWGKRGSSETDTGEHDVQLCRKKETQP